MPPRLRPRLCAHTKGAMISASKEAIAALARADHGDPFSILGMHGGGGALTDRAFRPDAAKLEVIELGGTRTWPAVSMSSVTRKKRNTVVPNVSMRLWGATVTCVFSMAYWMLSSLSI